MASSNQLMSSSRNCASFNRDQGSQIHLHRAIKKVVACLKINEWLETSLAQLSKDIQQSLKRIQAAVIAGDERATGTAITEAAKHTLANQTGQDNEDFDKAIKETRSAIAGTLDCLPGQRALVLALGKLKDITTDMEISDAKSVGSTVDDLLGKLEVSVPGYDQNCALV
ncbi:hypothetical protein BSLG_006066 [Batrachochytrium salamandrivorans]|nr:hypothetical protein BSLG_006066 [Batrachochytrium salamandrivorans]